MQRWQLPLQPCYGKRGRGLAGGKMMGKRPGETKAEPGWLRSSSTHATEKNPPELLQAKTPLLRAGGVRKSPAPSLLCQLTLLHASPFQRSQYSHGHRFQPRDAQGRIPSLLCISGAAHAKQR